MSSGLQFVVSQYHFLIRFQLMEIGKCIRLDIILTKYNYIYKWFPKSTRKNFGDEKKNTKINFINTDFDFIDYKST